MQAYSEQVESPDPFANEPKPMSLQHFDFPWKFVSAQLKNSKGDEIFYSDPDNYALDLQWAQLLEGVDCKLLDLVKMTRKSCM